MTNDANAAARDAAQSAAAELEVTATSLVRYHSRGRVLIIGSGDDVDAAAYLLPEPLSATLLRRDDGGPEDDLTVPLAGRELRLSGHMGAFEVHLGEPGKPGYQRLAADLVLDIGWPPVVDVPMKPAGYLCSDTDAESLERAAAELGELTGTFDKPRFFEYDADICAHGRSGQPGCSRCIEACPAGAITGLVESIEVDPYLCQGGGVCASVCPSGAIRYAYPRPGELLERVRRLIRTYAGAGGETPVLALVAGADREAWGELPGNLLVVEIEESGSAGLEVWLAALAYGARQVLLLRGASCLAEVDAEMDRQVEYGRTLLNYAGYDPECLAALAAGASLPAPPAPPSGARVASFAPNGDKRNMLFAAVDALLAHLDTAGESVDMPPGAPFGRVRVAGDRCTLCMACTSVCPASALVAGGDRPRLDFIEVNCVQCGICYRACPEQAISLEPRLNVDRYARRRQLPLHEDEPFLCVSCGKPFASRSVIDRMRGRLAEHPMFATERARRRLLMCDDCRVVDVVQDDEAMGRPV